MAKNFPNFMKNINLHIQEDKYWQAYGENETLAHCWRDCKIKIVQLLWKTVCRFLKNFLKTTIRSTNTTSSYVSKRLKSGSQRDVITPIFITALFKIIKMQKQPCRAGKWRQSGFLTQVSGQLREAVSPQPWRGLITSVLITSVLETVSDQLFP